MKFKNYLYLFAVLILTSLLCCTKETYDETENDDSDNNEQDFDYGQVTDVEGNEYNTVIIGEQEWMAENLNTSKYRDGSDILEISDEEEWFNNDEGAYFVLPAEELEGIDSPEQFMDIYGKHYNWYAIIDNRGLCPAGWRVPTDDDWTVLENYLTTTHDLHNDEESDEQNGVGNYLKSCRQSETPLGGSCETEEHPYWKGFENMYGVDHYGFSAVPAGEVLVNGYAHGITGLCTFWSYSLQGDNSSVNRVLVNNSAAMVTDFSLHKNGVSIRCMRDVE